jgi:hypothetical protein
MNTMNILLLQLSTLKARDDVLRCRHGHILILAD